MMTNFNQSFTVPFKNELLLTIQISQGSRETEIRWGDRFYGNFFNSTSLNATVKKWLKLAVLEKVILKIKVPPFSQLILYYAIKSHAFLLAGLLNVTSYSVLGIQTKISQMLVVHEWLKKIKHAACLRNNESSLTGGLHVGHHCRQLTQLAYT